MIKDNPYFLLATCGLGTYALLGDPEEDILNILSGNGCSFKTTPQNGDYKTAAIFTRSTEFNLLQLENLIQCAISLKTEQVYVDIGDLSVASIGLNISDLRKHVEILMINSGYRKHPLSMIAASYEGMDFTRDLKAVFEKVPLLTENKFPPVEHKSQLDPEIDLSREAGRKSDAAIQRYYHASHFVRHGERVLDAACGTGYGSYIIARNTLASIVQGIDKSDVDIRYAIANFGDNKSIRYETGDVCKLDKIRDTSIDVLVAMELLNHIETPEKFLIEAKRVLRPGGRILVSVPHTWRNNISDHQRIYDFNEIKETIGNYFLLESAWGQCAGEGLNGHASPRTFEEIDFNHPESNINAEWWILLGIKDYEDNEGAVYEEPSFDIGFPVTSNVVAYERDYDNPWLVRSLVTIGWRIRNPQLLEIKIRNGLNVSDPHSADRGAYLCVEAYRLLKSDVDVIDETLISNIREYTAQNPKNVQVVRWQISLEYVLALHYLKYHDLGECKNTLTRLTILPWKVYSGLIAIKVVSAYELLGKIALAENNREDALTYFKSGVNTAIEALQSNPYHVIGSFERPHHFGMRELSDIALLGQKCVEGIEALRNHEAQEGFVWGQIEQLAIRLVNENWWVRELKYDNNALRHDNNALRHDNNALRQELNAIRSNRLYRLRNKLYYLFKLIFRRKHKDASTRKI